MVKQNIRVNLRLTPAAVAALEALAPSENKRGAFVSDLLVQAHQAALAPAALDGTEAAYASIGRQAVALVREFARFLPGDEQPGGAG